MVVQNYFSIHPEIMYKVCVSPLSNDCSLMFDVLSCIYGFVMGIDFFLFFQKSYLSELTKLIFFMCKKGSIKRHSVNSHK